MLSSQQDTEITIGTGRMLVLFFALVLVCAVFFAIGFSLGRKTTMAGVANSANAPGTTPAAVVRPSAAKDAAPKPGSQAGDLSFYKSVGSSGANAELSPAEAQTQPQASNTSAPPAPSAPASASVAPGSGYFVQVAAVSRQEDAEALVEALKKKQYPAFTANSSGDKFYRVQVGPYTDLKDAEAMRARLVSDGYNPIVKR